MKTQVAVALWLLTMQVSADAILGSGTFTASGHAVAFQGTTVDQFDKTETVGLPTSFGGFVRLQLSGAAVIDDPPPPGKDPTDSLVNVSVEQISNITGALVDF